MKNLVLASVATSALAFSVAAEARSSSETEFRGYTTCVNYAEARSDGLVPEREYFIAKKDANTQYFVNATRWEDGERNAIRVACETAARGMQLVSATIENGRFTNAQPTVTVEVAQN